MADALKAEGNAAIAAKDFDLAVDKFTQAIEIDPSNHIFYSNRSAAYASKKDYEAALTDADKVIELKPDWAKGYGRKGAACHGLGDLLGAHDAYEEGLKLEPTNAQNKSGLASVKRAIDAEAKADGVMDADPTGGIGSMFQDPQLYKKLAANPKTSSYLADPTFMAKLQKLQQQPDMSQDMFSDPRMIQVLGVMMGVDMSMMDGAAAQAPGGPLHKDSPSGNDDDDVDMPDLMPAPKPSQKSAAKAPEPEPQAEPEDEEALAAKQAKEEAEEEKKLGTENYKKRQFDEAIAHYAKAWELHKDITYLNNLGAAKFEKGDYQGAIDACTQAVEHGREVYADFKMIAKSYGRIGSAYEKLGDYQLAMDNFQKALTEHRTPDIVNKLRAVEKLKIEKARQEYVDPEKAEAARELGNKKFKESDMPGAVEAYTEMIKRAPDDPRGYSNRAAAFMKLLEFPSALEDCDLAIKKDKTFIRAYIRKAQAYFGMRDYSKCLDACTEADEVDVSKANTKEIEQQRQKALTTMYSSRADETEDQTKERISKDPEIQSILQDPVMSSILQQAQNDPAALQEHMRNPGIRAKIQKLIAAGVIRTR